MQLTEQAARLHFHSVLQQDLFCYSVTAGASALSGPFLYKHNTVLYLTTCAAIKEWNDGVEDKHHCWFSAFLQVGGRREELNFTLSVRNLGKYCSNIYFFLCLNL